MGVTSLPVPAVVGMQARGRARAFSAVIKGGDQLRDVHAAAAAEADDGVGAESAGGAQRGGEFIKRRFAFKAVPECRFAAAILDDRNERVAKPAGRRRRDDENASRATVHEVCGTAQRRLAAEGHGADIENGEKPPCWLRHGIRLRPEKGLLVVSAF